jgi:hypothetical protein
MSQVDWKEADVAPLLKQLSDPQFKGVDILLSNAWPQGILNELGYAITTQSLISISFFLCVQFQ